MKREVEIKVKVSNYEETLKKLKEKGIKFSEPIWQRDVVFTQDTRPFLEHRVGRNYIRIRESAKGTFLALKQSREAGLDKLEFELKIEDADMMEKILLEMGCTEHVRIYKERMVGKIGNYEICLDRVEDLGDFLEIEEMTEKSYEESASEMWKMAEGFGLDKKDEIKIGYDVLMYQKQG